MKRILYALIILTILFTTSSACKKLTTANSSAKGTTTESSQVQSVNSDEVLSNQKNTELVLCFDNIEIGNSIDSETMNQKLRETICLYSTLDETQKESLIKEYLRKMDTYKETPDSVTYDNGIPLVDYYSDKVRGKMSFVFHTYDENSTGKDANTNASGDTIICTTINLSDFQEIGYLAYTCDNQQRTNHESLFDTKKNLIATVDYQYLNSISFPFITKYKEIGNHNDITDDVLNINQKFWLYKNKAKFDNSGKWTGYAADIYNQNSGYDFTCSYNTNGNLEKIIGEKDKKPDILNEIKLNYQKKGQLSTVSYTRPATIYGTTDDDGEMHYDDKGRMIYRENYITHGTQYAFYLYNSDDKRPWICINLDSEIWGNVKDGVDYGNPVNAYLFQHS